MAGRLPSLMSSSSGACVLRTLILGGFHTVLRLSASGQMAWNPKTTRAI